MSGSTEHYHNMNATYAQVDKRKNEEPANETNDYDEVAREDLHLNLSSSPQPYLEMSMYSSIQSGDSTPVVDGTDESSAPMYSLLQRSDRPISVPVKKGSFHETHKFIERQPKSCCYHLLPLALVCFAIVSLALSIAIIILFLQVSNIKSQHDHMQENIKQSMSQNGSVVDIPTVSMTTSTSSPDHTNSIISIHENISYLLRALENTTKDIQTLSQSLAVTWGLNYTLRKELHRADSNFKRVKKTIARLGTSDAYPATSCEDILFLKPESTSGTYWIRSTNGSAVPVYCRMSACSEVGKAWIRVGGFNATDCPENFVNKSEHMLNYGDACFPNSQGCTSILYPTHKIKYSKVCGVVKGVGVGSPDGFSNANINGNYVNGVSITRGDQGSRRHIWTFVAEHGSHFRRSCDCSSNEPTFVSNNYHCMEVVSTNENWVCTCRDCQNLFQVSLPHDTTDNIEVRVCTDQHSSDEQIGVRTTELYVQ